MHMGAKKATFGKTAQTAEYQRKVRIGQVTPVT